MATNTIPEANVNFASNQIPSLCQIPGGFYAVSNGYLGAEQQQVFLYSESGVIQSGIYCPTVNTTGFYMNCMDYLGDLYLAIGAGELYIVNVNNPTAPVGVFSAPFTPALSPVQYVKSVLWYNDGITLPYLMVQSTDSPGAQTFNIFKIEFTNNTFAVIATDVFVTLDSYAENTNALNLLQSTGEMFILHQDQSIQIWKLNTLTQTSTINANTAVTTATVFNVLPDISYTYTWVLQTQIASTELLSGLAVSWTNPNEIYITNTVGDVWYGALVNGAYSLIVFPAITTAYQSINTVPSGSGGFNSKALNYGIANQNPHGVYNTITEITGVAKNDVSGEFLLTSGGNLISFPTTDITTENFSVTFVNGNLLWANNGTDIFAGLKDIFYTQTFIDAINAALLEAYNKFPPNTFAEAPVMTLDFVSGLLTLTYSGDYSTVGNGILFNNALLQLCKFPSSIDAVDSSFNLLSLKLLSTSTSQTSRSIYLFNKLSDVNFISNTIYVVNSYFGNNNTNQIITSVQVPISQFIDNVGQVLFYQPNFLRTYTMASNNPLQRLQLQINYVYNDGTNYALTLAPFTNWQCDLKFIRKY
jgi:hypothetical protein